MVDLATRACHHLGMYSRKVNKTEASLLLEYAYMLVTYIFDALQVASPIIHLLYSILFYDRLTQMKAFSGSMFLKIMREIHGQEQAW